MVASDGGLAYLSPETRIDKAFVARVSRGRTHRETVSLRAAVAQEGCCHRFDSRWGLAGNIVVKVSVAQRALPRRSIRKRCRWYAEQGGAWRLDRRSSVTSDPRTSCHDEWMPAPFLDRDTYLKLVDTQRDGLSTQTRSIALAGRHGRDRRI